MIDIVNSTTFNNKKDKRRQGYILRLGGRRTHEAGIPGYENHVNESQSSAVTSVVPFRLKNASTVRNSTATEKGTQ